MILLQQALNIVDRTAQPLPHEQITASAALGRLMVTPLHAPFDVPAWPRSAMDGYAIRRSDQDAQLSVVEHVAAGQIPTTTVTPGTAVKTMTGAPVADGAELVVRVEYADEQAGQVRFHRRERSSNIVARGENARVGEPVLSPRVLRPIDLAVVAAYGYQTVEVLQKPSVGVLSTGDELRTAADDLAPGQIYDSNGPQLVALAAAYGCNARFYGIVPDRSQALRTALEQALAENTFVLMSGGVSMGDFDVTAEVVRDLGLQLQFHRVAIKPGRPTLFASHPRGYLFGLPGNPVSVFVTFELFVRRLLFRCAGLTPERVTVPVELGADLRSKDTKRTEFVPVSLADGTAMPLRYSGSSHLSALAAADGLLTVPTGTEHLPKGSTVDVRPI